jgi:predicted MFS family arabinose efflux permease
MLIGLAMFAAGMVLIALWPTLPALYLALILGAAGKGVFDPGMQAFVGDRVPYERRGTALAITEMSWSAAFLVGVPVAGWLIARSDWRAPFPWLAALGVIAALAIWRLIPADPPHPTGARPSLIGSLRTVIAHPAALGALAVALGISVANEVVNVVFGAWIEGAFALQVTALGAASAVIGLSELGGEGLVAALVDRVGKRRAVAMGIALNAGACLLLPFTGFSLAGALAGLFLFYLTFEFSVVASVPLLSELVPGARATMMAGYGAAFSLGRALGAWIGPLLFARGMMSNGIAGAILDGLALSVLLLVVRQE